MTVRQIAVALLDGYELEGKYVNLSLSSHMTDGMSREDKALLTALLYTTVEHKLTYDYIIAALTGRSTDKLDIHTLNILRLGMCQLLHMERIPHHAAVNETVGLGRNKGERGLVNGVLRTALRRMETDELPMPDRAKNEARYLSVAYSFPLWLVRRFISIFGERETECLLSAFNRAGYTDITVNRSLISREELLGRLVNEGINASPSTLSPLGIRIGGSQDPRRLPGFDEGYFFVQDSASLASATVLGTEEGDSVIDVCACPGGKSFAAAILAGESGSVLSLDLHDSKLPLISDGAHRLRLDSITVEKCDATAPRVELFGTFDRVICDVPCSGLGVLAKKPDLRYRSEESIGGLPELQNNILEASSGYLKTGGTLVYSTCTLVPEENEGVVRRFLALHPEFTAVDFTVGELSSKDGMLTLLPHRDGTDGFFISKLKKNG